LAGVAYDVIGSLGAGPLGELLFGHGPHYIDQVEKAADETPALLRALNEVWTEGMGLFRSEWGGSPPILT